MKRFNEFQGILHLSLYTFSLFLRFLCLFSANFSAQKCKLLFFLYEGCQFPDESNIRELPVESCGKTQENVFNAWKARHRAGFREMNSHSTLYSC